ncbi:MAG: polysaccharide biosynthesis C-terminal domain-containing protein [Chloroflexota bacterium]
MKQILAQSGWTIFMSVVTAAASFGISLVSARTLGPEGRGGYVLALLIINTVSFVVNPGIYASANYFASTKKIPLNRLIGMTLLLSGLASLVALPVATGATIILGRTQTAVSPMMIGVIGLGAMAATVSISLSGVLFGARQAKVVSVWTIVSILLHLAAVLTTWVLEMTSLEWFVIFITAVHTLDVIAKFLLIQKFVLADVKIDWSDIKPIMQYGGSVYSGRVLMLLAQKVDTWLLFVLAGQTALGFYSIATSFAEQLWMIPTAVSMVMMANIGAKSNDEAAQMTVTASQTVLVLALPAALILGAGGVWLIPFLYGAEFTPSVLPFALMLPGILAVSSYLILEPYFQSRGEPLIPVKITVGGAIANFALSLILIPAYGLVGAGIAYSTSYFFQLGLTCIAFRRKSQQPFLSPVNISEVMGKGIERLRQLLQQREAQTV